MLLGGSVLDASEVELWGKRVLWGQLWQYCCEKSWGRDQFEGDLSEIQPGIWCGRERIHLGVVNDITQHFLST